MDVRWASAACCGVGVEIAAEGVPGPARWLSGAAGQTFRVADQHALARQADPATLGEIGERLIDGFPRRPDQLGDLHLSSGRGSPAGHRPARCRSVARAPAAAWRPAQARRSRSDRPGRCWCGAAGGPTPAAAARRSEVARAIHARNTSRPIQAARTSVIVITLDVRGPGSKPTAPRTCPAAP